MARDHCRRLRYTANQIAFSLDLSQAFNSLGTVLVPAWIDAHVARRDVFRAGNGGGCNASCRTLQNIDTAYFLMAALLACSSYSCGACNRVCGRLFK